MKHYAGLDVSVKETSICIVDEAGRICREMKVVSHPEDLLAVLCDPAWRLERVGLEAGPLSQWLFSGLAEAGVPAICIETRHAKAFLKAQVNKSDRSLSDVGCLVITWEALSTLGPIRKRERRLFKCEKMNIRCACELCICAINKRLTNSAKKSDSP